jgi:hypothetical protein
MVDQKRNITLYVRGRGPEGEPWARYQQRLLRVPIPSCEAGAMFVSVIESAAKSKQDKPMNRMARELVRLAQWPPERSFAIESYDDILDRWGGPEDAWWQAALRAAWSLTLQNVRKQHCPRM